MSEMSPSNPGSGQESEMDLEDPTLQRIRELADEYAEMPTKQFSEGQNIDPDRVKEIENELRGLAKEPIVKTTYLELSKKMDRTDSEDRLMRGLNIALGYN